MLTVSEVEAAGGYDVLYADPPWSYSNGGIGAAADRYRTLSVKELCALPVRRLAARDSLLFLWVTWPFLCERHQAHDVAAAWGFELKTCAFCWVKRTAGGGDKVMTGFYTLGSTEVCLVGRRGRGRRADLPEARGMRQLLEERAQPEVLSAAVGRHSAKPPEVRRRVETLCGPEATRLELFARERVAGWDCLGDQVPGGADVSFETADPRQLAIPGVEVLIR